MDIYRSRSIWRVILGVCGGFLLVITLFYSNYLASQLEENENKQGVFFIEALNTVSKNDNLNASVEFESTILDSIALPVIFQGEDGTLYGTNWSTEQDTNTAFLQKKVDDFLNAGREPEIGPGGYASLVYVFNSPTLTYIRYFPIVQIILVSIFVIFAYFLFNASRRAEQNRVWAGMAKETAHQLGTPISAILGWIEYLKTLSHDPEQQEVLGELIKDVERLELVADRFSKIGSTPALKKISLYDEIMKCKAYMQRRSPKKVKYNLPEKTSDQIFVNINQHLFDWVIENLYRNALDAMDGQGEISTRIYHDNHFACVEIQDTGKGIPSSKFKSVFKPGYSTKQRGWGLGLSLAKRIIESYHKGKIFVKTSKVGEGTTFTIKLPLAEN